MGNACLAIRHRKFRAMFLFTFLLHEWRVKPNDIALSVSACFLLCLLHVIYFVVEIAVP